METLSLPESWNKTYLTQVRDALTRQLRLCVTSSVGFCTFCVFFVSFFVVRLVAGGEAKKALYATSGKHVV